MLAHVSAYTILEGLRRQVAQKLMHAPLGSVLSKPIGSLKSTIVDRIEDIEPPLAHMIPELSSNVLLPIVVVIALFAMDWRMGLASLATIPAALIPMAAGLRTYNEKYAAYMAANAQVNSIIVEYVEGIEVVKAFNQSGASYEKFVRAVTSFRDFTLDWFRCTWKSMNLCLSILPTTLLATLPVGIALYQTGVLDPARLALCLMLVLGIVSPLVQAAAFLNSMKSMEFAVRGHSASAGSGGAARGVRSPPASPAAVSLCGMCPSRIAGKKRTLCCVTLIWNFLPVPSPLWWVPPAAANLRQPGLSLGSGM